MIKQIDGIFIIYAPKPDGSPGRVMGRVVGGVLEIERNGDLVRVPVSQLAECAARQTGKQG